MRLKELTNKIKFEKILEKYKNKPLKSNFSGLYI